MIQAYYDVKSLLKNIKAQYENRNTQPCFKLPQIYGQDQSPSLLLCSIPINRPAKNLTTIKKTQNRYSSRLHSLTPIQMDEKRTRTCQSQGRDVITPKKHKIRVNRNTRQQNWNENSIKQWTVVDTLTTD